MENCIIFLKLTISERCDKIRSKSICSKCLKVKHSFASCNHICELCQGRHHHLVCKGPGIHAKHNDTGENPFVNKPDTDNNLFASRLKAGKSLYVSEVNTSNLNQVYPVHSLSQQNSVENPVSQRARVHIPLIITQHWDQTISIKLRQ